MLWGKWSPLQDWQDWQEWDTHTADRGQFIKFVDPSGQKQQ